MSQLFPVRSIQERVAQEFGVSLTDMLSVRRTTGIVLARHVAIYLALLLTKHSQSRIGTMFGRDHATVIHAWTKIGNLRAEDPGLNARINRLEQELRVAREGAELAADAIDGVLQKIRDRLIRAATRNPKAALDVLTDVANKLEQRL